MRWEKVSHKKATFHFHYGILTKEIIMVHLRWDAGTQITRECALLTHVRRNICFGSSWHSVRDQPKLRIYAPYIYPYDERAQDVSVIYFLYVHDFPFNITNLTFLVWFTLCWTVFNCIVGLTIKHIFAYTYTKPVLLRP